LAFITDTCCVLYQLDAEVIQLKLTSSFSTQILICLLLEYAPAVTVS